MDAQPSVKGREIACFIKPHGKTGQCRSVEYISGPAQANCRNQAFVQQIPFDSGGEFAPDGIAIHIRIGIAKRGFEIVSQRIADVDSTIDELFLQVVKGDPRQPAV